MAKRSAAMSSIASGPCLPRNYAACVPRRTFFMLLTAGSPDQVDFVHDFLRLDVRGTDGHNHSVVRLTKKSAAGEARAIPTRCRVGGMAPAKWYHVLELILTYVSQCFRFAEGGALHYLTLRRWWSQVVDTPNDPCRGNLKRCSDPSAYPFSRQFKFHFMRHRENTFCSLFEQ